MRRRKTDEEREQEEASHSREREQHVQNQKGVISEDPHHSTLGVQDIGHL